MKKYLALLIILILVSSVFGQNNKIYIHKDYDNNTRKENNVVYGHLNKYSTYYSTTIPIDSMKLYNTTSDTTKDTTMVYEIWDNMGFVATVGTDTNAAGDTRPVNIQVFIYEGWAADSVTRTISTKIDSFNIDTTGTIEHEFTLSTQPHFFMEFIGLAGSDTVYIYDMKLIRRRFTANGSSIDHGRLQGLADNDHPQYLLGSAHDDSMAVLRNNMIDSALVVLNDSMPILRNNMIDSAIVVMNDSMPILRNNMMDTAIVALTDTMPVLRDNMIDSALVVLNDSIPVLRNNMVDSAAAVTADTITDLLSRDETFAGQITFTDTIYFNNVAIGTIINGDTAYIDTLNVDFIRLAEALQINGVDLFDSLQYILEDTLALIPFLASDNTFTGTTNTFKDLAADTIIVDTLLADYINIAEDIDVGRDASLSDGALTVTESDSSVAINGGLTVTGGFILPTHAHAELFTIDSALTTVSTGGTYYHLANSFDVTFVNRFSLLTDSLKYIGSDSVLIKWDFDLSASSDTPIEHGIWQVYVNSTGLGNSGIIHRDFKTANTEGSLGCNGLVILGTNDVIYVLMTSVKNGTLWKHESIHFTVFEIERIPIN